MARRKLRECLQADLVRRKSWECELLAALLRELASGLAPGAVCTLLHDVALCDLRAAPQRDGLAHEQQQLLSFVLATCLVSSFCLSCAFVWDRREYHLSLEICSLPRTTPGCLDDQQSFVTCLHVHCSSDRVVLPLF